MWFWLVAAIAVVVGIVLVYLDGRRRERAVAHDWELALTPRGERAFQKMEKRVKADVNLVDIAYQKAFEARDVGEWDEALRMVDVGCDLIEQMAPTMIRALAAMAVLSRMAAAIAPVRPLRPKDFRVGQLVQLARLNRFVHHLLVTTGERFRFRVFVLQRGFKTIAALVFRWTHRAGPAAGPQWAHLAAAHQDVGTLSDESLEMFRTLLVSLAAERRG